MKAIRKLSVFIVMAALLHSGSAFAQNITIKAIDCVNWPEVRISAFLPDKEESAERYTLQAPPDGQTIPALAVAGQKDEFKKSSIVVALDTSRSLSADRLESAKKALTDYVNQLGEDEQISLLAFNDTVQVVAGFTNDKSFFTQSFAGLKTAGSKTELYKAMLFGLDSLKNHSGRKLLLVISDGHDEGAQISREQVSKAAADNNIQISVVGLPENSGDSKKHLEVMESFAKDSKGIYRKADSAVALSLAVYDLLQVHRANRQAGYLYDLKFIFPQAKVQVDELKGVLTRKTADASQSVTVTLTPPASAVDKSPPPADEKSPSSSPELDFLHQHQLWFGGGGALLVLLLLLLFIRARSKQKNAAAPVAQHIPAQPRIAPSPFVLEFAELGLTFPLTQGVLSLGAHPGNAMVVNPPGIHFYAEYYLEHKCIYQSHSL